VTFAGWQSDVVRFTRAMEVFVMPSRWESASAAILTAMACGKPIVATAVGGNPELIEDGRSGILVPPDDPDRMARAIAELLDDPVRARAYGRRGREVVAARFTLAHMAEGYGRLYRSLRPGTI